MNAPERLIVPAPPVTRWPGLGVWNLYFLLKFLLLGLGLLNFQALPNPVFAAFLVVPFRAPWRIVRQLIAIPVGIALLYHDTWLPRSTGCWHNRGAGFSPAYLVEPAGRFVDWTVLGLCALLVIGYSYMANWIRLSTICLGGLIWLNRATSSAGITTACRCRPVVASAQGNDAPALQDNVALDTWLENFFRTEASRQTQFPCAASKPRRSTCCSSMSARWPGTIWTRSSYATTLCSNAWTSSSIVSTPPRPTAGRRPSGCCEPAAVSPVTRPCTNPRRNNACCSRTRQPGLPRRNPDEPQRQVRRLRR